MKPGDRSDAFYPVPESVYPAIEWPAIATGKRATLLALQYQLQGTEWWPRDVIKAQQYRQAHLLVQHARDTVPYYSNRLDMLAKLKGLDDAAWQRIPILTRDDIQTHGEELLSSSIPDEHGTTTVQQSSGSTGRPVSVTITELNSLFFAALNLRHLLWHKLNFHKSIAAIRVVRPKEMDHVRLNKPIPWVAGHASGPMHLFDVGLPVSRQVAWLEEQQPAYLLTLPSNLEAILDVVEPGKHSLSSLAKIMTMSEIIGPGLRDRCKDVLGADVCDSYSAYEVGMIALQCPDYEHYHVQAESLLVEVINEEGLPCQVGEVGRVVITDLHNFAMPLIRYEVGDYAEVGPSCPCGRGLPVLQRIYGRKRNMLTYPSGDKSWPLPFLSSELIPLAPIKQIQLVQHTKDEIEVNLATSRALTQEEENSLKELFQTRLHHPFKIRFTYVEAIKRSAGGKFEDFISMVNT